MDSFIDGDVILKSKTISGKMGVIALLIIAVFFILITYSPAMADEKVLSLDKIRGESESAQKAKADGENAGAGWLAKAGETAVKAGEKAEVKPSPIAPEDRKETGKPVTKDKKDTVKPEESVKPKEKADEGVKPGETGTPMAGKEELKPGEKLSEINWGERQKDIGYPEPKSSINIPLTILWLLVVCLLAYVLLKVFGKYLGGTVPGAGGNRMINILEKQMLGPNKQICIMEVPGKIVLVGITENEMNVLCELDSESVKEFRENSDKGDSSKSPSLNYLSDVLLRRWQGGGGK